MCLILSITAFVAFALLNLLSKKKNTAASTTMLMFLSASLMWCVDGIANIMEGEPFFDISQEDTVLGIIIVASGLIVFSILTLVKKHRKTSHT